MMTSRSSDFRRISTVTGRSVTVPSILHESRFSLWVPLESQGHLVEGCTMYTISLVLEELRNSNHINYDVLLTQVEDEKTHKTTFAAGEYFFTRE